MRKRFGVLLTLAVLAVLMCGLSVAVAAEDTVVYVGGVALTPGTYVTNDMMSMENPGNAESGTLPASGYAALSEDGKTLTLNGFDNNGKVCVYKTKYNEYTSAIYTGTDLTIVLSGENKITSDEGDGITGYENGTDIVIEGSGSLEIYAKYGIYVYKGTLTIKGGTVDIDEAHDGIYVYGGNVTISGGTVDIDADNDGISAEYGNVTISNSTVTIEAEYFGILATNDIILNDDVLLKLPDGGVIDEYTYDNIYTYTTILDGETLAASIRIEPKPATTAYFGKVFRSMQTISFPGVPELDGLWRAFGSTINLTKITPEPRDGYTFTGWFADEACTKPITKIVVTGNMQLFAGWEEIAAEEEETGTAEAAG